MTDTAMTPMQWQMQWLSRCPPPIPANVWSNGAPCPWCGFANATVTYGMNNCMECSRPFAFGILRGAMTQSCLLGLS